MQTLAEIPVTEKWVVLYSYAQDAYHIEEKSVYASKPQNGYRVVSEHDSEVAAMVAGIEARKERGYRGWVAFSGVIAS